ncbi:hypothetical protein IWQ61_000488 [Dispira simplex]|nr:hypothetical protein IWQ61_000488 [Dispira simplex]
MKINILTIAPLFLAAVLTTVSATSSDECASKSTPEVPTIIIEDVSADATDATELNTVKDAIRKKLQGYTNKDGSFNFVNDSEFWSSDRGIELSKTIGDILAENNEGIPREDFLGIIGMFGGFLSTQLQEQFVKAEIGDKKYISEEQLSAVLARLRATNPGGSTRA